MTQLVPDRAHELTVGVSSVTIDVLVQPRMNCVAIVILLQLLLGRRLGGRRVRGDAGPSWTGAPGAGQQVGLQPRNQTASCAQVAQSAAPGGLQLHVHSDGDTATW